MAETAIKMNTQSGKELPDVDAHDGPLARNLLGLLDRLDAGSLDVDAYQRGVKAEYLRPDLLGELRTWLAQAHAERADQTLYRRTTPTHRISLQLIYVDPREVHPPHGHHNLISSQMVLDGQLDAREYDRVARLDADTLLLRLLSDGITRYGDVVQATEVARNVHWFATDERPCVLLNHYVLGYQSWTFDPPGSRLKGRKLVDPTRAAQRDGLIVAPELPLEAGYKHFGNRRLSEFPIPQFQPGA
jgi:hypothetical protein